MSQPPRRPTRPARPTRTPTSRPRRVAGQGRVEPETDAPPTAAEEAPSTVVEEGAPAPVSRPRDSSDETPPDPPDRRTPSRRPLVVLAVVAVLLLALGVAEVAYLASGPDVPEAVAPTAERPVQASELTVRSVVDQAAKAADSIISATADGYDAEVDAAAALMTEPFAATFRETKEQVQAEFVAQGTTVVAEVSYQGVVRATPTEVTALLFLTQTTQKGNPPQVTPVQYRVTVTMVDTPDGWLVSDLQAL
ncbi:hypothetical protein [Nocardioides litoris]|uniref:hypothetical protein n=1 Tax=Nocardioides litoris TaxID=1926648 RepID=UPI001123D86B|nr:hypothetical protein [Nocardioides litoris]